MEKEKNNIFQSKIDEMENSKLQYSKPQCFAEYLKKNNLPPKNTASSISVQSLSKLDPTLRKNGYMVFRLGSRPNVKGTFFGLAKLERIEDWSEYFLLDDLIFKDVKSEVFVPDVSVRQLFAFNLLSSLTENSLINLAISSGLMASALSTETSESLAAPASAQGHFSFDFKPNPNAPNIWKHNQGQVEIDALFVGRRQGKEVLFVIEAKTSRKFDSLAKYKLVYPILALSEKVREYNIDIIPVYLRAIKQDDRREINFYIAECEPINISKTVSISELKIVPNKVKNLILFGFNDIKI